MKRFIMLVLILLLVVSFVGCSNYEVIYDGEAELESKEVGENLWAIYFNTDCLEEENEHLALSDVTITLLLYDHENRLSFSNKINQIYIIENKLIKY